MAPTDEQNTGRGGPAGAWRADEARGDAPMLDLPAVIRPRPLMLAGLEALVLHDSPFARSLGRRPEQVDAIARVVFHHDGAARERFGDVAALTGYVRTLLGLAG